MSPLQPRQSSMLLRSAAIAWCSGVSDPKEGMTRINSGFMVVSVRQKDGSWVICHDSSWFINNHIFWHRFFHVFPHGFEHFGAQRCLAIATWSHPHPQAGLGLELGAQGGVHGGAVAGHLADLQPGRVSPGTSWVIWPKNIQKHSKKQLIGKWLSSLVEFNLEILGNALGSIVEQQAALLGGCPLPAAQQPWTPHVVPVDHGVLTAGGRGPSTKTGRNFRNLDKMVLVKFVNAKIYRLEGLSSTSISYLKLIKIAGASWNYLGYQCNYDSSVFVLKRYKTVTFGCHWI